MADIRIKDLATTASTTASDDFMAVDGTTNGTRKLSAATPSFATSVTVPGVAGPTATNLTLTGGSTGASLVLGQGVSAPTALFSATGTGTNSAQTVVEIAATTSGTPVAGYGPSLRLTRKGNDGGSPGFVAGIRGSATAGSGASQYNGDLILMSRSGGSVVDVATATQSGNLLIGGTTDITGSGGLKVFGTTAASSTGSGALQVGSNVGLSGNAGGPSYFGGAVTSTDNITAPDLILGASGPSAKSSIAARAARQGLVFDGTAESTATLTSALGSTDKSVAVTVLVKEASNAIFHFGTSNATVARQLQVGLLSTRKLRVELLGATTGDIRQANTDSAIADNNKFAHVVCTISGSTLTIYVNGVSVSYTEVTAGTPPAWSDTVNGTAVEFGGTAGVNFASTALETPSIYNRALSAAEVVSLYEAGVPAGTDYNTASNTNLATTTVVASGGTLSGESATGFTMTSASGVAYVGTRPTFGATTTGLAGVAPVGSRWLVTFTATLTSGAAPSLSILQTNSFASISNTATVTAGSNSVVLTTTANGTWVVCPTFYTTSASTYTISAITVTRLGLLLAPDAAQSGGGLTWYDTSGNAANITLPATGVTWNVPTSGKAFSLSLASTTAGSAGAGALVVTGGLSAGNNGNASYFGGAVTVPSLFMSTDAQGSILSSVSNILNIDAAAGDIRVRPKAGSAFIIGNSAGLRLGNAYVATPVASTGYITIQDSTGTTYKVAVSL